MSTPSLSIAVLVSAGRHPVSGIARACRGDAVALALARKLGGDRLRVIHAGKAEEPSIRDYLALGAGRVEVLSTSDGQDPAQPLAAHLKDVGVILTGSRAEVGAGSGMFPYRLAHAMGRPLVGNVLDARIDEDGVTVRQFLPKGRRRGIAAPVPIVLVVHPMAPAQLKYAHARRVAGRVEAVSGFAAPELGDASASVPAWSIDPAPRRPVRLKAQENKTGHARLQSAIVFEAKGGTVAFDGSSVDKAQIMLNYLREHRLVDF